MKALLMKLPIREYFSEYVDAMFGYVINGGKDMVGKIHYCFMNYFFQLSLSFLISRLPIGMSGEKMKFQYKLIASKIN